ncbi:MAG: lysophospholipase [Proteobacteria bacterium]|nr:lysophospholipase [Pseudomonadota bacterium]MBU1387937.1 lysophospholipase [Pseudomonadota bacterium]MBU1542000.1 lysophospholipase [Pseudomonadota bacterium]MBU2430575.1 lysophospholipase [Pseudomonadota bacterium]MBU2481925.1 lysophospholipase [Pseudomonadota bacterium]
MTQSDTTQAYAILDHPRVLQYLFHPRADFGMRPPAENRQDFMIPVDETVQVGASFHSVSNAAPVILFFHGNGEIVSDYDDLGGVFNQAGLNFFVADYRGYGSSGGTPAVSTMIRDCHAIFDFVKSFMAQKKMTGQLCVMGRSLGSASALELAAKREKEFDCLVIESGFAWIKPLLETLGIFLEKNPDLPRGLENVDKIKNFSNPCLVIHAQFDHIIPFTDGQALHDACGSKNKTLLQIPGANHNDIFLRGMDLYLENLKKILLTLRS